MALRGDNVLAAFDLPDFEPLRPFDSGFAQTIAAAFWPQSNDLPEPTELEVEVAPDEMILLTSYSRSEKAARAALLVHGLTGSYQSTYIQRLSGRLLAKGYDVYCLNMRNSGPGLGRAASTYHAGRSEDVEAALRKIAAQRETPYTQFAVLGFSLGANIVLKMLGEQRVKDLPIRAIAVSPPIELAESTKRLASMRGKFFDVLFSYNTFKQFTAMAPYLKKEMPDVKWNPRLTLAELDDQLTAPLNDYDSAEAYYAANSAAQHFAKIETPTLVLTSDDDPVICPNFLLAVEKNPYVAIVVTKHGGHVAFLDRRAKVRRWMDELVVRWLR